jgi:hypothetical protein
MPRRDPEATRNQTETAVRDPNTKLASPKIGEPRNPAPIIPRTSGLSGMRLNTRLILAEITTRSIIDHEWVFAPFST